MIIKNRRHLLIIFLFLTFYISWFTTYVKASPIELMKEVRSGWDVFPIYEITHPPGPKCIGEDNDFYYLDNLNYVLMKMDEFNVHTEYLSLSMPFNDIIYQPSFNRFLGVNDFGFYAINLSGVELLNNYSYGIPLTTMTLDPTDDSLYCGSIQNGTNILKFNADCSFNTTIISNVQGCSQIVLNNNQSFLYYTETYHGSFSILNLTSFSSTVIKTGIGLPGTQEVIGIGVDDDDELYYMTADGSNRGFYKYVNNSFILLMASKAGMSTLTWSTKLKIFLAAGSGGGCLIGYDPMKSEAELLTPVVNSQTVIETLNGDILYVIENMIYKINISGPTFFTKNPNNLTIQKLILDVDDNIFALLNNDTVAIVRVKDDGSFEDWFNNEINEWAKAIYYDIKNYEIILLTEDSPLNKTNIYRIPIDDPLNYYKIISIENSTRIVGVADVHGNFYVYEAYNNTLFRVPDGSMDLEIITTDFVNFSDIYGGNVIVEPPLGYSTIENGILIGRNDDLQIWLLDESLRITFAINNRGIDNMAIFETFSHEIICTQSTLVLKFIYREPQLIMIPSPAQFYILAVFLGIIVSIYTYNKNKKCYS